MVKLEVGEKVGLKRVIHLLHVNYGRESGFKGRLGKDGEIHLS